MLAEHAEKALIALLLFATWQMLRARSIVIYDLTKATFLLILCENIGREALILADEARQYQGLAASPDFGGHD